MDRLWGRERVTVSLSDWGSSSIHGNKGGVFREAWSLISIRRFYTVLLRSRLGQQLVTVAACLAWMAASSWAILVNKHIMVDLHFPYPCTIAWMGLATTTLASYTALKLTRAPFTTATTAVLTTVGTGSVATSGIALSVASSPSAPSSPVVPFSSSSPPFSCPHMTTRYYLTRVLPTGFFMALTFQTGNMGYLYLTVAFVQMLKAFCPVITMLLLFAMRLEAPSGRLVASVGLIAVGVALASYGELNLSLYGLTAMLISVFAESVRLVLTQHLLVAGGGGGTNLSPLDGLYYISSACTVVLAIQASYTEWPKLVAARHFATVAAYPYRFGVAACCGFAVNMLAITVIKLASSLTLKVLGSVKDAALVSIGILFLHEHVTVTQLVGYSISMVGFVAYNVIKSRQPPHHPHLGGVGPGQGAAPGQRSSFFGFSTLGMKFDRGPGGGLLPLYAVADDRGNNSKAR